MLFMCTYQVDRDKQADTQAFFANMTEEQIAGEHPAGVTQIGRWHDIPNGNGWIVVESDNQEALTSWIMGWSGQCALERQRPDCPYDLRGWTTTGSTIDFHSAVDVRVSLSVG